MRIHVLSRRSHFSFPYKTKNDFENKIKRNAKKNYFNRQKRTQNCAELLNSFDALNRRMKINERYRKMMIKIQCD